VPAGEPEALTATETVVAATAAAATEAAHCHPDGPDISLDAAYAAKLQLCN
jgi:hypothetical protein